MQASVGLPTSLWRLLHKQGSDEPRLCNWLQDALRRVPFDHVRSFQLIIDGPQDEAYASYVHTSLTASGWRGEPARAPLNLLGLFNETPQPSKAIAPGSSELTRYDWQSECEVVVVGAHSWYEAGAPSTSEDILARIAAATAGCASGVLVWLQVRDLDCQLFDFVAQRGLVPLHTSAFAHELVDEFDRLGYISTAHRTRMILPASTQNYAAVCARLASVDVWPAMADQGEIDVAERHILAWRPSRR